MQNATLKVRLILTLPNRGLNFCSNGIKQELRIKICCNCQTVWLPLTMSLSTWWQKIALATAHSQQPDKYSCLSQHTSALFSQPTRRELMLLGFCVAEEKTRTIVQLDTWLQCKCFRDCVTGRGELTNVSWLRSSGQVFVTHVTALASLASRAIS